MYEVRNRHNVIVSVNGVQVRDQVLNAAKARAEALHIQTGEHYTVYNVQDVWTTQTLEEAIEE
jgi:hypothetical protein